MDNKSAIPPNNNLKEHERAVLGASNKGHMKGPWNHIYTANSAPYTTADGSGFTNLSGFSWPPRMYVCSFCEREFRSAQALGGHMNVHRRDRARLRQSPPSSPPMDLVEGNCPIVPDSINLNLIPSPSPNLTQSSSTPMIQKHNNNTIATYITNSSTIPSLKSSCPFIFSSSSGSSASGMKVWSVARPNPSKTKTPNLIDANNYTQHHTNFRKTWENGERLRLGFGTSAIGKEDLDLELRLGYPS